MTRDRCYDERTAPDQVSKLRVGERHDSKPPMSLASTSTPILAVTRPERRGITPLLSDSFKERLDDLLAARINIRP